MQATTDRALTKDAKSAQNEISKPLVVSNAIHLWILSMAAFFHPVIHGYPGKLLLILLQARFDVVLAKYEYKRRHEHS